MSSRRFMRGSESGLAGCLAAMLTIMVWGTTFISTKLLLADFGPVEILFFRFAMGFGASALCFVTWNFAIRALGAVKTSAYIYMVPVITVATSALVLREPVTWASVIGTALAVAGLFLSEYNGKRLFYSGDEKEERKNESAE